MQSAAPTGTDVDEALLASYDGVGNVRDAIRLGARRIGHGIEAVKDVSLMAELAERRSVCLEICQISNRRLRYCEGGLSTHPLRELLNAGVPCCLAADDPAFFGASTSHGLSREFTAARHFLGLDDLALAELARASLRHSLAPPGVQQAALAAVDAWLAEKRSE